MELQVLSRKGGASTSVVVSDAVFAAKINTDVTHQVMVSQLANQRQGTSDTKRRGEVAGGGAKPYRQKGTGRARQGSIRAPHYRGGGVIFGPHPRSYEQQIPKQMRQAALRSVLSSRVAEGTLKIYDELSVSEPKTREVAAMLNDFGIESSVLFLITGEQADFRRAARNLPRVQVLPAQQASVTDLLRPAVVVTTPEGLKVLEARLTRRGTNASEA
jgi:large subunit ribosomal protein L4